LLDLGAAQIRGRQATRRMPVDPQAPRFTPEAPQRPPWASAPCWLSFARLMQQRAYRRAPRNKSPFVEPPPPPPQQKNKKQQSGCFCACWKLPAWPIDALARLAAGARSKEINPEFAQRTITLGMQSRGPSGSLLTRGKLPVVRFKNQAEVAEPPLATLGIALRPFKGRTSRSAASAPQKRSINHRSRPNRFGSSLIRAPG